MIKYIKLIAGSADPKPGSVDRQGSSRPIGVGTIAGVPSCHASLWVGLLISSSLFAVAGPEGGAGRAGARRRAAAADGRSYFRGLCDP